MDKLDFEDIKMKAAPARVGFRYQLKTKDTLESMNIEFPPNRKSLTSSARSVTSLAIQAGKQCNYIHMFEVKISVSLPWRTSPLKYEERGPWPSLSFCKAIYLYVSARSQTNDTIYIPICRKRARLCERELLFYT